MKEDIPHSHCPFDCEHPQPIVDDITGEEWCGRCWFESKVRTKMIPCTPETCTEDK